MFDVTFSNWIYGSFLLCNHSMCFFYRFLREPDSEAGKYYNRVLKRKQAKLEEAERLKREERERAERERAERERAERDRRDRERAERDKKERERKAKDRAAEADLDSSDDDSEENRQKKVCPSPISTALLWKNFL